LFLQYDATRPSVRQPEQGRVYGSNNHGHVVYLTDREQENLNNLELLAGCFALAAFVIDFSVREHALLGEIRSQIQEEAYSLSTTAGWYELGRALCRRLATIGPSIRRESWQRPTSIDIRTNDPISECRSHLMRDVYLNSVCVSGNFNGKRLHLYVHRENFYNSFAPHFYGVLESLSSEARLRGQFRMHSFVRIFLGVWFGFFITTEVWFLISLELRVAMLLPLAFILCGLLMVYSGKDLAMDDKNRITHFLERSMGAHKDQDI
jgi:hypothetical protein